MHIDRKSGTLLLFYPYPLENQIKTASKRFQVRNLMACFKFQMSAWKWTTINIRTFILLIFDLNLRWNCLNFKLLFFAVCFFHSFRPQILVETTMNTEKKNEKSDFSATKSKGNSKYIFPLVETHTMAWHSV